MKCIILKEENAWNIFSKKQPNAFDDFYYILKSIEEEKYLTKYKPSLLKPHLKKYIFVYREKISKSSHNTFFLNQSEIKTQKNKTKKSL